MNERENSCQIIRYNIPKEWQANVLKQKKRVLLWKNKPNTYEQSVSQSLAIFKQKVMGRP